VMGLERDHRIEVRERLLIHLTAHIRNAAIDPKLDFRRLCEVPVIQRFGAEIDRFVRRITTQYVITAAARVRIASNDGNRAGIVSLR